MEAKIRLATFNTRFDNPADGVNRWKNRRQYIIEAINRRSPDIIGFQELDTAEGHRLEESLGGYCLVGCGRESDMTGSGCMIGYKKSAFDLIGLRNFWLSRTPRVAGTRYTGIGQSIYPRMCTSALLQHRTTRGLVSVYNTQLDAAGSAAAVQGLSFIAETIKREHNPRVMSTVLMGTFNLLPGSRPTIELESKEGLGLVDLTKQLACESTLHGFGKAPKPGEKAKKVDYIYSDSNTARGADCPELWRERYGEVYLSDHYPVSVTVTVKPPKK